MKSDPHEDRESINELLKLYNNLRNGYSGVIEEEAFEKSIDYYDDQEEEGDSAHHRRLDEHAMARSGGGSCDRRAVPTVVVVDRPRCPSRPARSVTDSRLSSARFSRPYVAHVPELPDTETRSGREAQS